MIFIAINHWIIPSLTRNDLLNEAHWLIHSVCNNEIVFRFYEKKVLSGFCRYRNSSWRQYFSINRLRAPTHVFTCGKSRDELIVIIIHTFSCKKKKILKFLGNDNQSRWRIRRSFDRRMHWSNRCVSVTVSLSSNTINARNFQGNNCTVAIIMGDFHALLVIVDNGEYLCLLYSSPVNLLTVLNRPRQDRLGHYFHCNVQRRWYLNSIKFMHWGVDDMDQVCNRCRTRYAYNDTPNIV